MWYLLMGFRGGSDGKESTCDAGDPGSNTEEPGGLHTAHGVSRSQTRLNDWHTISIQWVLFPCRKE